MTSGQAVGRSAAEATLLLEQALAKVEAMPRELAELKESLRGVLERLQAALDHLSGEARRLSDEASGLAVVSERLESHLSELTAALTGLPLAPASAPGARPQAPPPPREPQFAAGNGPVDVVLASVPGYQGLMDALRALGDLPGAHASVVGYRNGEASMQLSLSTPVTVRQIVDALRQSTGHQLLIEEARPEASRLRLRFASAEGRG
jgi:hypothetical protein